MPPSSRAPPLPNRRRHLTNACAVPKLACVVNATTSIPATPLTLPAANPGPFRPSVGFT